MHLESIDYKDAILGYDQFKRIIGLENRINCNLSSIYYFLLEEKNWIKRRKKVPPEEGRIRKNDRVQKNRNRKNWIEQETYRIET